MKTVLVILILCSVMVMAGCSTGGYPGMVDSAQERDHRIGQIDDYNMRMIVDDWDAIWLRDRRSKLTRWTTYGGS